MKSPRKREDVNINVRPSEWEGDPEELGTPELGILGAKVFPVLLRSGFKPPIYFALIWPSGAMRLGRFLSDRTRSVGETVAGYTPKAGAEGDIHCMFVDSQSRSARLMMGGEGWSRLTLWIGDGESSFNLK